MSTIGCRKQSKNGVRSTKSRVAAFGRTADSGGGMNAKSMTSWVSVTVSVTFVALACAFAFDLFGHAEKVALIPAVDPKFTNTATVRLSAAQQIKAGEDTSGLDCYACHPKSPAPVIKRDEKGTIVLPKEHEDLVMLHGRNGRNESCYNCHDPDKLDMLKGRDGKQYTWAESSQLCGSCHGTTFRDWEVGIHGRTSGYWDRSKGPVVREECASCHHPHSPQFPAIAPAPGPHRLHPLSPQPEGHH